MSASLVSVIIAVKNGQDTLKKSIDSILSCAYDNFEIICVDDGSTDKTAEILKSYSGRLKVIANISSAGPSRARNEAAVAAAGEFLAFTDADCVVDEHWLAELVRCFTGSEVAAAGGRQAVPEDDSAFGKDVSLFMRALGFLTDYLHSGEGIAEVEHNPSCNSMYRKSVFLEAGGFLAGLWPGEDVELDYRLRKKRLTIMFNPAAVVYHYRPDSPRKFYKMMSRYGWAQGILVRKYGFFRPLQFAPLVIAASAFFLAWLLVSDWKVGAFVAAGVSLAAWGYFLSVIRSFTGAFAFFFLFCSLIFHWNSGFLKGVLAPKAGLS